MNQPDLSRLRRRLLAGDAPRRMRSVKNLSDDEQDDLTDRLSVMLEAAGQQNARDWILHSGFKFIGFNLGETRLSNLMQAYRRGWDRVAADRGARLVLVDLDEGFIEAEVRAWAKQTNVCLSNIISGITGAYFLEDRDLFGFLLGPWVAGKLGTPERVRKVG